MMRQAVEAFLRMGALPDSDAPEAVIAEWQSALLRITSPVTDEEAAALVKCFGADDCYGLAWTLLHLVESAPHGIPVKTAPLDSENEWLIRLWDRSRR